MTTFLFSFHKEVVLLLFVSPLWIMTLFSKHFVSECLLGTVYVFIPTRVQYSNKQLDHVNILYDVAIEGLLVHSHAFLYYAISKHFLDG